MKRRTFLKAGVGAWAGLTVGSRPRHVLAAPETEWRKFEVITKLEVANPTGITRGWVPLPLLTDTDYFKRQGDTFTGNAGTTRVIKDSKYDLGMVYAEWPATERAPAVEVTSRFSTRDRNIDLTKAPTEAVREGKAVLARYLEPTQLIPTDGIVRETAQIELE